MEKRIGKYMWNDVKVKRHDMSHHAGARLEITADRALGSLVLGTLALGACGGGGGSRGAGGGLGLGGSWRSGRCVGDLGEERGLRLGASSG